MTKPIPNETSKEFERKAWKILVQKTLSYGDMPGVTKEEPLPGMYLLRSQEHPVWGNSICASRLVSPSEIEPFLSRNEPTVVWFEEPKTAEALQTQSQPSLIGCYCLLPQTQVSSDSPSLDISGFAIRRVQDHGDYAQWLRAFFEVYSFRKEDKVFLKRWWEALYSIESGQHLRWKYWLAEDEQEHPIGTVGLYEGDEAALLLHLTVVSERRGEGVGKNLIQAAHAELTKPCFVFAAQNPDVFKALGYTKLTEFGMMGFEGAHPWQ